MKRLSVAASIAALVAGVGTAHAARPGIIISQKFAPTVKVVSGNEQTYDQIQGNTYPVTMQAAGHCGKNETVDRATARSLTWPGSESEIDTSELRAHDTGFNLRTVQVPYSLTPIEWHANWKKAALDACNHNLVQQMNARHWTAKQVLARDWTLDNVSVGQVEGLLSCNDKPSIGDGTGFNSSGVPTYRMNASAHVKVICGKHQFDDFAAPKKPKTPTDDLTYGVHVVQSNLAILPKTGGAQPCGVTLSGMIETDAINISVTLFYRNNKGGTTPWRTVKTDHSKTAFFSDFIDFSKPGPGSFTQPTPHPTGPAQGTFAAPQSDKEFSGTYQIVGKSIAFQSNIGHFAFNCASPPVNNFKGVLPPPPPPGGESAKPATPRMKTKS